eukprot:TRINITY_DN7593_c0_g2_i1.p1 TRINITY_DN7593_c0_g2~~TRINITY_DN7593_c0_g2_i1.p1  ORF type:complete len:190 (-),score=70.20 TRINITY_DN7593_c0_g2_i1:3-572(-)
MNWNKKKVTNQNLLSELEDLKQREIVLKNDIEKDSEKKNELENKLNELDGFIKEKDVLIEQVRKDALDKNNEKENEIQQERNKLKDQEELLKKELEKTIEKVKATEETLEKERAEREKLQHALAQAETGKKDILDERDALEGHCGHLVTVMEQHLKQLAELKDAAGKQASCKDCPICLSRVEVWKGYQN